MDIWYDIEDYEKEEDEIEIKEYDITSTPNDYNIATLFNLIDNGIIKMPPFQRNYVWDVKRASKLIESIILGLPIPQVFLYERGKNNFYVIDGQQRLLTIYFFVKQRFPNKAGRDILRDYLTGEEKINADVLAQDKYFSNFSLKLTSPVPTETNKFNNLKYETLGDYKHIFDYLRTIRTVVIKQNEPDDQDSSMYEIFNRLNTGGQNLTQQEIRMSLFYSDFYAMVLKLNKNEKWRQILGQETADVHFKDLEIIVRSFAMLFYHEKYQATMNRFLNKFSKMTNRFEKEDVDYLEQVFLKFIESCSDLKEKSFCSASGKFSISFFESVFVATCENSFKSKLFVEGKITQESLEALKSDVEYINACKESMSSKKNVETRMSRAKEIIKLQ
ncbi:MAG: DUF262 domain-containing protein [Lachnospiraceae bacterium]|nr:DUF262 domain-containing protein [Lachnospiraceae bacterium]